MYTREVTCGVPACGSPATHKVAAPWSAGAFSELKSYGLACAGHCGQVFRDAKRRAKLHPPSSEEVLGEIGIYGFAKGKRDRDLQRLKDLEAQG
jgi:hypothetical protein